MLGAQPAKRAGERLCRRARTDRQLPVETGCLHSDLYSAREQQLGAKINLPARVNPSTSSMATPGSHLGKSAPDKTIFFFPRFSELMSALCSLGVPLNFRGGMGTSESDSWSPTFGWSLGVSLGPLSQPLWGGKPQGLP